MTKYLKELPADARAMLREMSAAAHFAALTFGDDGVKTAEFQALSLAVLFEISELRARNADLEARIDALQREINAIGEAS